MQPDKEPFYAEKYLLSMWQCGCYINTQNIIDMGSSLGLELSFKKRSSLLQALLLYVKKLHKEQQFLSLISDLLDHKVEAFSDENLIVITTSPITGSTAACSSRFNISSISPLTGLLVSSNSGGSFGLHLKRAGFDGLIITGRSQEPVYIDI